MLVFLCMYSTVLEYREAVVKPLTVKPLGDLGDWVSVKSQHAVAWLGFRVLWLGSLGTFFPYP
jgi:hypothetical protein